jgi:hypothetical protein
MDGVTAEILFELASNSESRKKFRYGPYNRVDHYFQINRMMCDAAMNGKYFLVLPEGVKLEPDTRKYFRNPSGFEIRDDLDGNTVISWAHVSRER